MDIYKCASNLNCQNSSVSRPISTRRLNSQNPWGSRPMCARKLSSIWRPMVFKVFETHLSWPPNGPLLIACAPSLVTTASTETEAQVHPHDYNRLHWCRDTSHVGVHLPTPSWRPKSPWDTSAFTHADAKVSVIAIAFVKKKSTSWQVRKVCLSYMPACKN